MDANVHTLDLMNRLHALDAALASCQRRAIDVGELSRVWHQHRTGFEGLSAADGEWVDDLLRKMAMRHGIVGLVPLRDIPSPSAPEIEVDHRS